MPSHSLIDENDPAELQIAKYRKITNALMRRVERDTDKTGGAYSLFQRAVALEAEVRSRTRDLQETLGDLNRVNEKLEVASAVAAEANRAKSRFLAAASHDVMQPLNAAKLFIDSLTATPLDAHQRRTLERVESALGSVEGILDALLQISRLDTSGIQPEVSALPLRRILDVIASEFEPLAATRGVAFRYLPSRAWVCTDPTYLRQIVQNLVSNAIRYCDGGQVVLGCRRQGPHLRLEVHDTGPGIASADLSRIFEEFQRLRPSDTAVASEGVGLGLAIVERACRLLDHPLDVRSQLGRGSVFSVTVPLASADAVDQADEIDMTLLALLVTTDPMLAAQLEGMFESWGMVALVARSVEEGQGIVAQLGVAPDAVLIDSASVSALSSGTPEALGVSARAILLLSDSADASQTPGFVSLEKPVRAHRLRAAIESIRAQRPVAG